ncbi:MAG: V-type ATP synthase subunit A [Deltaproteobacteria bacterium]|nr:V-type ATP synthase subunit A [Deltaproteobacteria bacterium]
MKTKGKVTGIVSNLVTIAADGPVAQNEICYIELKGQKLMAEVIKMERGIAYAQVFESTRNLKVGDEAEFTGRLLEVSLGPGMLSKVYDGLQNDLYKMESLFLKRGEYTEAFDHDRQWRFTPLMQTGDAVHASDWLGEVKEGWIRHRIMVPFDCKGTATIRHIVAEGEYRTGETIATIVDEEDNERAISMIMKWPVKRAVKNYRHKPRPFRVMETGIRVIDVMNPMAEGGTGFIPGPFGCGKTVLQHALAKNADADLIIVVACGERANEVVEIFQDFPELDDPRTGRKLMERTIIICNTSNMPVAAREASVYTGMTIAEYYRAMGLKVLILADSTSRWAQAMREISNRMEELPGPDAFPMDLPATVANFYSRAGFVYLPNGESGSVTFIGTVSPAGGNLKEPVTESTKKAARTFYALSQNRADSKRYPAIDPVESYSKYLEYPEVRDCLNSLMERGWCDRVSYLKDMLQKGMEVSNQIKILGDDGVPVGYHETFWKAETIDFSILQQDSFDRIDASTPLERQKYMVDLVTDLCKSDFHFEHFDEVAPYFKRIINRLRQMNYLEYESDAFEKERASLAELLKERRRV